MGKTDFNGLSQWTGRIGGLVFKVVNGQQVITPYKKEVFNPRSEAQMLHRAKFALSGMINKIVPKEVLVGMSPDRQSRRLLFASNIIRHANVSVDSGVVKATLNANDLVFSQGVAAPVTVSGMTVTDGLVSGNLSALPEKVDAVMMIAVVYDSSTRARFTRWCPLGRLPSASTRRPPRVAMWRTFMRCRCRSHQRGSASRAAPTGQSARPTTISSTR